MLDSTHSMHMPRKSRSSRQTVTSERNVETWERCCRKRFAIGLVDARKSRWLTNR